MDYLENFEILESQEGLLSPNQDPFVPPFPHSPLPELNTPICSTKSTLTASSPITPFSPGDPNLSIEDLFETGPHSSDMPSPPPMNSIFQPVQEPDISTSNKETPASILPAISTSKVELQLQQISAEKPFSPASKPAEDTTLYASTIPNLLSLALRPPSPTQPPATEITQVSSSQVQLPPSPLQSLVTQIT